MTQFNFDERIAEAKSKTRKLFMTFLVGFIWFSVAVVAEAIFIDSLSPGMRVAFLICFALIGMCIGWNGDNVSETLEIKEEREQFRKEVERVIEEKRRAKDEGQK